MGILGYIAGSVALFYLGIESIDRGLNVLLPAICFLVGLHFAVQGVLDIVGEIESARDERNG